MSGAASVRPGVDRVARLAAELCEREVDVLLVETPINLRYLTGFTGTHGLALLAAEAAGAGKLGQHRFLTDFRYGTQSDEQVADSFAREIVTGSLLEAVAASLGAASGRLGFDEASLTVGEHTRLRELLAPEWELVACGGMVERMRAVKDADELRRIRAAAELADEALRGVLEDGVVHRSERDVAAWRY